jgi:hypothetical protein
MAYERLPVRPGKAAKVMDFLRVLHALAKVRNIQMTLVQQPAWMVRRWRGRRPPIRLLFEARLAPISWVHLPQAFVSEGFYSVGKEFG